MIDWKDPRILDRIRRFFADNPRAPISACARHLGVSKNALVCAIHRRGWHAELGLAPGHSRRLTKQEREAIAAERQRAEGLARAARIAEIRATAAPPPRRRAVTREDMMSWSRRAAEAIAAGEVTVTRCRDGYAYGAFKSETLSITLMGRMR